MMHNTPFSVFDLLSNENNDTKDFYKKMNDLNKQLLDKDEIIKNNNIQNKLRYDNLFKDYQKIDSNYQNKLAALDDNISINLSIINSLEDVNRQYKAENDNLKESIKLIEIENAKLQSYYIDKNDKYNNYKYEMNNKLSDKNKEISQYKNTIQELINENESLRNTQTQFLLKLSLLDQLFK